MRRQWKTYLMQSSRLWFATCEGCKVDECLMGEWLISEWLVGDF